MFNGAFSRRSGLAYVHSGAIHPFHSMMTLDEIGYKTNHYRLAIPLDVYIDFDGHGFAIHNEDVSCRGEGDTFEEAIGDFSSEFVSRIHIANKYGRKGNDIADRIMYHVEGFRCA